MPYVETVKNRAQFFFSVTGLPEVSSPEKRRVLRFRIRNLTIQGKVLSYGHKPIAVELNSKRYNEVVKGKASMQAQNWSHLEGEVGWGLCEEGPMFLVFEYTLRPEAVKNDHIMIAYVHPYNVTDMEMANVELEQALRKQDPEVYFHKEVLINSMEGNAMHLITITRQEGWSELE